MRWRCPCARLPSASRGCLVEIVGFAEPPQPPAEPQKSRKPTTNIAESRRWAPLGRPFGRRAGALCRARETSGQGAGAPSRAWSTRETASPGKSTRSCGASSCSSCGTRTAPTSLRLPSSSLPASAATSSTSIAAQRQPRRRAPSWRSRRARRRRTRRPRRRRRWRTSPQTAPTSYGVLARLAARRRGARGRQDRRGSRRLRGDRQGQRRRCPARRLRAAAGGHVEAGQRQLDGHAESAHPSGSRRQRVAFQRPGAARAGGAEGRQARRGAHRVPAAPERPRHAAQHRRARPNHACHADRGGVDRRAGAEVRTGGRGQGAGKAARTRNPNRRGKLRDGDEHEGQRQG